MRNDPHRASDGKVCETFYEAVESSLNGPYADLAFASPEEVRTDGSIFLSISSFRDEVCPDTLENAFATASTPEKVFVGLVQQNCDQKQHDAYGCKTAVMPITCGSTTWTRTSIVCRRTVLVVMPNATRSEL